jgi:hypothetical protein
MGGWENWKTRKLHVKRKSGMWQVCPKLGSFPTLTISFGACQACENLSRQFGSLYHHVQYNSPKLGNFISFSLWASQSSHTVMSTRRPLRGSCGCGRNNYIIAVPENAADSAHVFFDSSSENRWSLKI